MANARRSRHAEICGKRIRTWNHVEMGRKVKRLEDARAQAALRRVRVICRAARRAAVLDAVGPPSRIAYSRGQASGLSGGSVI